MPWSERSGSTPEIRLHANLARALESKGRRGAAIEHYLQALNIAPRSSRLHSELGLVLLGDRRLDEAIEHMRQSVSIDPKSAHAHLNLSVALSSMGRADEGFAHVQQCVSLAPSFAAAHYSVALRLRDRGRLAEAIDQLQQATRLEGDKPTTAWYWLVLTRYQAAGAYVKAAAGQRSEDARRGEAERAGLRRQALVWLRANLELTTKLRNDGQVLTLSLSTLLSDPALASVRDPAALAKLPDLEREPWQRLWTDVAASLAADPLEQGHERAARRQWDRAIDSYARRFTLGPTENGHFWFEYAALSLLSGDRPAYVRTCARMIEHYGKAGDPRSYHVARNCTMAEGSVADPSLPGRLAEKELKDSGREYWSLTEQGALAYRTGRFQQAVPFFEQSVQADRKSGRAVLNWLWLALTNQRLGKGEEARLWLNRARAWLDQ